MDPAAKQQIVERLKQANSVLVTVSNNPTVDQLAACIGTTLLLNKLGKHATAVFSGTVPSTIEFLQPEKTIEKNTDSLRDFIISLDKSKADKLRYKVEDQVVRIFITPYRSKISEKDLVFSEGDFNVEAVLALGVQSREQIDAAITAHGRILHDATVITINSGVAQATTMGQINWQDPVASSLCEMVVSISEAFGTGLIDGQMATAFLTGIVAETQRFSNDRTSPRVMTMSAQLMAAGANQQLIATRLDVTAPVQVARAGKDDKQPADSGSLAISHNDNKKPAVAAPPAPGQIQIDAQGNLIPGSSTKPPTPPPPRPFQNPAPPAPIPPAAPTAIPPSATPMPTPLAAPAPAMPAQTGTYAPPPAWPPATQPAPAVPSPIATRPYLGGNQFQPQPIGAGLPPAVQPPALNGEVLATEAAPGTNNTFSYAGAPAAQPIVPTPDLSSARNAVESAISAVPYTPDFDKVAALGSQPINVGLNQTPATAPVVTTPPTTPPASPTAAMPPVQPVAKPSGPNGDTPSLSLPMNGNTPPPVTPAVSSPPTSSGPRPPAGPPPLMPTS